MNTLLLFVLSSTLSGFIYDKNTSTPLQAHIYVADLEQVYSCDSLGAFTIPNIPQSIFELVVSHVGFKDETLSVTIRETDTTRITIGLQTAPIRIEVVETTGERMVTSGKQLFQKAEMEIMPGAEQNVFRVIQTMPGVSSASDYLGLFYVRGGELHENKVIFDNVEILAPYHYFGVGSTFNADLIEDFEFFTGALPVRYGDAVSSILLLHSKDVPGKQKGAVSLDLIEANLTYHSLLSDNLSVAIAAKRNYLDLLLRQMGIVEGVLLPYFFDMQGKIDLRTELGDFILSGLFSREGTDIRASFEDQTLDLQMSGTAHTGWIGWDLKTSGRLGCQAYAFYSDMNRFTQGMELDTISEDYSARKYGALFHTEFAAGSLTFSLGGSIGRYGMMHTGPKIEDVFYRIGALNYSLEADTDAYYSSCYAVQRIPAFGIFDCEISERIDWLPTIEKPVFSPRLKLTYRRNPSFFLAYGYLYQTPPLEYPVQECKPLQARSISMGFEYLIHPSLVGKIELYKKYYKNLIRGQSGDYFNNDGEGQASGIEFSLRRHLVGSLYGMVSYAYSSSERTTPYDSTVVITDVHRPHILNFFVGSQLPLGFQLGMQLQIASGIAYRPVIGREGYDEWEAVYALEKTRLPYYQRIDVHFGKGFSLLGVHGEIYITVMNITNHKNMQGYLYNWDYTLRRVVYMLPRMPLIGLRVEF
jgi:hypothetical protein